MHHRRILRETMHEQPRDETVAHVIRRAREERAAETATAMRWQHRYAELGHVFGECDMRDRREREVFVVDAEYRVGIEVDPLDILGDRRGGDHNAEAQPYIFAAETQEMAGELRPRAFAEPLHGHVLAHAVFRIDRQAFSLLLRAGGCGEFNRPPPCPRAADPRRRPSHFSHARSPASRSYAP